MVKSGGIPFSLWWFQSVFPVFYQHSTAQRWWSARRRPNTCDCGCWEQATWCYGWGGWEEGHPAPNGYCKWSFLLLHGHIVPGAYHGTRTHVHLEAIVRFFGLRSEGATMVRLWMPSQQHCVWLDWSFIRANSWLFNGHRFQALIPALKSAVYAHVCVYLLQDNYMVSIGELSHNNVY